MVETLARGRYPAAPVVDFRTAVFTGLWLLYLVSILLIALVRDRLLFPRWAMRGGTAPLRERVLRAGARLIISGRRMTLTLSSAAAPFSTQQWPRITTLHLAGP